MSLIPSGFFSFDPFADMEAMLGLRSGDSLRGAPSQGAASGSHSLVAHMSPLTSASLRCNLVEVSAMPSALGHELRNGFKLAVSCVRGWGSRLLGLGNQNRPSQSKQFVTNLNTDKHLSLH
jgi:hypothetical protein